MNAVGFDGWRGGWVGIRLHDGAFHEAVAGPELASLIDVADRAVGVDMPLGFPEGAEPRAFDVAARRRLVRRASTLFIVPPRDVMEEATYQDANRRSQERYGRGISAQVYALRKKIFEAIDVMDARFQEIHPEVAFADLAGEPLVEPKKTWAGQQRRRRLLAENGVDLPSDLGAAGRVPPDDVIDAAVVALTAWRASAGEVP